MQWAGLLDRRTQALSYTQAGREGDPRALAEAEIAEEYGTIDAACLRHEAACGERARQELPPRYRRWRLSDFPEKLQERAVAFIVGDDKHTLYLHGAFGTRKTSFAAAVLIAAAATCARGVYQARFVPAYDAARDLRNLENLAQTVEDWRGCNLLVLDDIGAQRSTPHVTEQLLLLIQCRYDCFRKTVITSNLTLEEFGERIDHRASSRFQEGICFDLGSQDWRKGARP